MKGKNKFPKVVKNPTPANRSMNTPLKVQKVATPANRKMNTKEMNSFPKIKKSSK